MGENVSDLWLVFDYSNVILCYCRYAVNVFVVNVQHEEIFEYHILYFIAEDCKLRSWEKDIKLPFDPFRQCVRSKVLVSLEGNNSNNTQFDHITAEQTLN